MSWETGLVVYHAFNRKTYKSKWEVEDDLEDAQKSMQYAKDRISRLAFITEPEKFMSKNDKEDGDINGIDFIQSELRDMFEMYEEAHYDVIWLTELLENWEKCHDEKTGKAIPAPYSDAWRKAFLDGDFIETVEYDTLQDKIEDSPKIEDVIDYQQGELFDEEGNAKQY